MEAHHHQSAVEVRELVVAATVPPSLFRAALTAVPPLDRDAWLDLVFGLDGPADDGPELPRGCVPYVPCPVATVLQVVETAHVQPHDVFVDLGSGVGRAAALVHLLTGAPAIGVEIQPALVEAAKCLAARLKSVRLAPVQGDAAQLAGLLTIGTVFFLYCPFSGERLDKVLDSLEPIARTRPIRVCSVDLPLPARPWLQLAAAPSGELTVYRSTAHFTVAAAQ